MHLSMSGGGTRALVYAAFFDRLDESKAGRAVLLSTTSISGVSAGALVGTPLAMRVPPAKIVEEMESGGLSDWLHIPRALAMMAGFTDYMYTGDKVYERMEHLCSGHELHIPITIGVTTSNMEQKCLKYTSRAGIINCTTASASVPGLFAPRKVRPVGLACDGGAVRSTFAVDAVLTALEAGDRVTLINSSPWPGFEQSIGTQNQRILIHALFAVRTHGMEWIQKEMGPGFRYQDGTFQYGRVTFVAPTGKQFAESGGAKTAGNMFFKGHSDHTRRLKAEGREIADRYVDLTSI
jgi:predicted acylesterase/phospholipase RssA